MYIYTRSLEEVHCSLAIPYTHMHWHMVVTLSLVGLGLKLGLGVGLRLGRISPHPCQSRGGGHSGLLKEKQY